MPPKRRPKGATKKRRRKRRGRKSTAGFINPPRAPASNGGIGASIGSSIGSWAERGLKSLFGSGDYEEEFASSPTPDVDENSIVRPESEANVPLLNSENVGKDGYMRVKHREFIMDVDTSTLAQIDEFGLNPQNSVLFPWLSSIAGNFEQWIPHGIVFEFVSTSGNAVSSTNASLGSISMATYYLAQSYPFQSKKQLLNHFFAVSSRPSANMMHAIECAPEDRQTHIYNTFANGNPAITEGDDRLYYLGTTTLWRQGAQSTYTAGELWITYDISLLKPRIQGLILNPTLSTGTDRLDMMRRLGVSRFTPEQEQEWKQIGIERQEEKEALERLIHPGHRNQPDNEDLRSVSSGFCPTPRYDHDDAGVSKWIDLKRLKNAVG